MTKDASFKKVVRRHAGETGQRTTRVLQLHGSRNPSCVPRVGRGCGMGTTVVRQQRARCLA
jgi:hypothetical protein